MERREFLLLSAGGLILLFRPALVKPQVMDNEHITLFLCGDVMSGRGIDQVLPHSVDPKLFEP